MNQSGETQGDVDLVSWSRRTLVLGLGVAVGLSFAVQFYLFRRLGTQPISWRGAALWEITRWSLLTIMAWPAWAWIRKHPIESLPRWRVLLVHGTSSLVFAFLHLVSFSVIYWMLVLSAHKAFGEVFTTFKMGLYRDSHLSVVLYWGLVILAQVLHYQRRSARLETQLAQAELQALRMQLQPHFLFNTLNSIAALMREDVRAADDMLVGLADFLRLTLDNSRAHLVTMREELDFLQHYLEIERIRFRDRLTINFEIEPQTLNAEVPYLILQPIVENAIKFGISARASPGRIDIRAMRRNGRLRLQVQDDGHGIANGGELDEGLGLTNTRERLRQLYLASHRLEMANAPAGGLLVSLEIPFSVSCDTVTEDLSEDLSD